MYQTVYKNYCCTTSFKYTTILIYIIKSIDSVNFHELN